MQLIIKTNEALSQWEAIKAQACTTGASRTAIKEGLGAMNGCCLTLEQYRTQQKWFKLVRKVEHMVDRMCTEQFGAKQVPHDYRCKYDHHDYPICWATEEDLRISIDCLVCDIVSDAVSCWNGTYYR